MNLSNVIAKWRQEAELLRRHGAVEAAATKEADALELEQFEQQYQLEHLTLASAALESGYTAAHLSALVANGSIPNVGRKHAPRILRRDLPRKPAPRSRTLVGQPDLVGRVLSSGGKS